MTQPAAISTHKLITFIVFVIAAIMSSLFIYRLSHESTNVSLAADAGTLFPVARDVKAFTLIDSHQAVFTEKNLQHHWTLMIFGFTHCASVCPTTLEMLKQAYEKLPANANVNVVLVSLDPTRDTPATLAAYTKSYNAHFIGLTGSIDSIRKLQSQFGIYSSNDASASNQYQLQHTSSIMLINPKGEWAGLFRYGLNVTQFSQALTAVMV